MTELFSKGILKVLWSFYKVACKGRVKEIVFRQEVLIALVVGLALAFAPIPHADISGKIVDICLAYVSYAAIALGFCVGGITVALTIPDREFSKRLAKLTVPQHEGDALSGLLFVFCWTAVVHWFSIIFFLALLVTLGRYENASLASTTLSERTIRGVASVVACYALMQFLITVLTLWQAGTAYVRNLQTAED